MTEAVYDDHVRLYVDFVDSVLAMEPSLFGEMLSGIEGLLGDRLEGARVCDVACGEGYVSRRLAQLGPREVVGIDLSAALVDVARERGDSPVLDFRVDDARELATVPDGSCDVVVSQMAVMDVSDQRAMFRAVRRVLTPDGIFVFSLLHPCFEGPYDPRDEPQFLVDEDGERVACMVRRYATEGHWHAEGAGVRGHVGSHHRMLSTYLNDLIESGFRLTRIEEPVFGDSGLFSQVPRVMIVACEPER